MSSSLSGNSDSRSEAGELHLHPIGDGGWVGTVYLAGSKRTETGTFPSAEHVKNEVAKAFGRDLKIVVLAQDGGMVLSEE